MDAFIKDFDKVLKRKRQLDKETLASIDSIISSLSSSAPLCVETASNLSESYRDMQQSIFKYQKQVDKRFKQDLDLELVKGAFDDKGQVVDKILANHFIRQGQFNVANSLAAETHTQIDPENTRLFSDMFTIVQGLKYKRVEAALEWCRLHSDKLEHNGSSLHFELHKVSYLSLVKQGALPACIQYAKKEFPKFATKHFKVNVETHWLDLIHTFCRDFCTLQGLGLEPLSTAVTVGSLALPTIGKMASIMKVQPGLEWTSHGELAMTIPLPEQYSYHTIFACPVSKEQATGVNPPMMMACGHVVGKESLLRLCKGNMNTRIKCPYCPSDSTASQALQVYF